MSLFFGCPQTLFNQGFCYVRNASPVSSFAHELRACPVAWPACPAGGGWPRPAAGARRCTMSDFMSHYLVPAAIVAVAIVLVLGLVNMMRGGSPNRSQQLMRLRVLLQFVAIIVIMATIWAMGR